MEASDIRLLVKWSVKRCQCLRMSDSHPFRQLTTDFRNAQSGDKTCPTGSALLVAQCLNRIETGRAYRGDHPAHQSHQRQDCGGNHYADGGNDQSNVTRLSVLGKRTVKGESPYREGNDVREPDS